MAFDPQRKDNLVRQLRSLNPDKSAWSDDSLLYQAAVDARDAGSLEQLPDLRDYYVDALKERRGLFGEFTGTFGSGVDQFQAQLYDTAALAGDITNNESLQKFGDEGRERNLREAAEFAPIIQKLEGVNSGSDFAYWLTGLVGSQSPQILGTAGAALGAAALAPEASIASLGGISASALAGFLAGGAVGFTQMQNYGSLKESGGDDIIPLSLANGLIGAALEAVGPAAAVKRLIGAGVKREVVRDVATSLLDRVPAPVMRTALATARDGSTEMLTELTQEALTIGTEIASNRNNPDFIISDEEVVSRLINSGVAGFILGGGLGAATEVVRRGTNVSDIEPESRKLELDEDTIPEEASLDVPVPGANVPPPAPLTPKVPEPVRRGESVAPPVSEPAQEFADAELVRSLVERGIPTESALTMTRDEAVEVLRQTAPKPTTPIPSMEELESARRLREEERMEQAAAEQAGPANPPRPLPPESGISPESDNLERDMLRAQEARERAKIVPFPIPEQPGATTPKRKSLSQTEIRRRANLYREAQSDEDADLIDLSSAQRFRLREEAPVIPISTEPVSPPVSETTPVTTETTPVTTETTPVTTETTPVPTETTPISTEPATTPESSSGGIPFVDNHLRGERFVAGPTDVIAPGDVVRGARPDERNRVEGGRYWTDKMTRNAAVVRGQDGSVWFVPAYRSRGGEVNALLSGKTPTRKEIAGPIADRVLQRLGKRVSARTINNILDGRAPEASTTTAERNQLVRDTAAELGYVPRQERSKDKKLSAFVEERGGRVIGVVQFQDALPAGARRINADPEQLSASIGAAVQRARDSGVYADSLSPSQVKSVESLDASRGNDGPAAIDVIADENAPIPGRERSGVEITSSTQTELPAVERVRLEDEQELVLARELGDEQSIDRLLNMSEAALVTSDFVQDFKSILSVDQRVVFDEMSADEQNNLMRSSLATARTLLDDETVLHRKPLGEYRASPPVAEGTLDRLIRSASRLGIDVRIAAANERASNAAFREEGGFYTPSNRTVTLVMDSMLRETPQATLTALHEIIHDVVRTEPEWVQTALHDMIERLPLGERAYFRNPRADRRLQDDDGTDRSLTEERLVEHLTFRGLDTQYAQNIVARVWRAVSEAFYRVALHLQKQFLGESNTSGDLARQYVEAKISRLVAGDFLPNKFLSQFGRKPNATKLGRLVFDDSAVHLRKTDEAGNIIYPFSPDGTVAATRYNVMAPLMAAKESLQLDGTYDQIAYGDEFADALYTRRQGKPWNESVVGDSINEINWSTIPSDGEYTHSFYNLDKKDLTMRLLKGRLLNQGNTATTPTGEQVRLLYSDYRNNSNDARLLHLMSGKGGSFESAHPTRVDLIGSVHDTIADPTFVYRDEGNGSTNYARVLTKSGGSDRVIHVVAVAERGGIHYVETQYFMGRDRIADRSDGPVIYKKDVPSDSADGTKGLGDNRTPQDGPNKRTLPQESDSGPGNVVNGDAGSGDVNGGEVLYRKSPTERGTIRITQAQAEAESRARVSVAVANQLDAVYTRLFERAKEQYADRPRDEILADRRAGRIAPDNLTYESFLKMHKIPNPRLVRETALAELKAQFETELEMTEDTGSAVAPDQNIESLPGNERGLAEYALSVQVGNLVAKIDTELRKNREELVSREEKYRRHLAEITAVDKNLGDISETDRMARGYIRGFLNDLKRDIKRHDRDAQALGHANATLAELEGSSNEELSTTFTDKILNSIGVDDVPLPSILNALYSLESADLDLRTAKPSDIRNAVLDEVTRDPESPLSYVVKDGGDSGAAVRGTALLSTIITFVKRHARLADVIRLQMMKTEESQKQLIALREMFGETSDQKLAEIQRAVTQDLKRPGNRVIYHWLRRRDEALRENALLSKNEQAADLLNTSLSVMRDFRDRVDSRRGIGLENPIVPGAKIVSPPSPDSSSEDVKASLVTLSMGRDRFLKSEQVRTILRNQKEWLEYRRDKPELRDEVYHTVARGHDKLKLAVASDEINVTLGGLSSGYNDSIGEMLKRTGTRGGALGKKMWVRFSQILRANQVAVVAAGKRFEIAAEKFYKIAEMSAEGAHEAFYRPALFYLGRASALTEEEAFGKLRDYFRESPVGEEIASDDKKWGAFTDWIHTARDNNQLMLSIARKAGLAVRDEKLVRQDFTTGSPQAAVRDTLERGVTGYTLPQKVHRQLAAIVSTMSERLKLLGDGPNNPFSDLPLRMRMSPDQVRESLAQFNTPEFIREFLEPLLTESTQSRVPAPDNGDGLRLSVPDYISAESWDGSGDVLRYAENVYNRMATNPTPEGLADYQQRVMSFVGKTFRQLDNHVNSDNPLQSIGIKGVGHFAMDARVADNFPSSWLDYAQFTPEDNRAALHLVAANAAFGRNFNDLNTVYVDIHNELRVLANEIARSPEERARMKKEKPEWFKLRENAEKSLKHVEDLPALTQRIFDPERGGMDEMGPLMEIYGGVITGMLFGIKSAIKNVISISDTLLVEKSLSRQSLQTVGRGYSAAGRNFLAALGNVFGADLLRNNRYISLIEAAGGFDVAPHMSTGSLLKGTRGRNNMFDRTAVGKIQRAARIARFFATNARLGFSKGAAGPALRAFNQFQYTQILSNYSITEALIKRFEDIALLGANYYDANPDQVGAALSADAIGYKDSRGFNALKEEALDHGFSLEDIAEKAHTRRKKGREIFDKDTVQKIMNMTLDRVAGESSPTNRPSYLLTSRFARANAALIGWSFFKTASVMRALRNARGRRDINSMLNGAALMTLGLVPITVAFSYLMDEYDEKLTGKKTSLKPVTEEDFFRAILERSTAMGAFGILGNVPDSIFNIKDGSGRYSLSVDQSIVWLNSVSQLIKTLGNGYHMGLENLNYTNFYRPIAQSLGGGGVLQYVQLANKLFPDNTIQSLPGFRQEAGATARTNAGNYLRASGRSIGLEIRAMGGSHTPNEVTPWITNMTLAAYRNDQKAFRAAYEGAVKAAYERGEPDPVMYVTRAYGSRHPLKSIFKVRPSQRDYGRLLATMTPTGKQAVNEAVEFFNRYGLQLGLEPYTGSTEPRTPRAVTQARQLNPADLARLRERLAASRMNNL